MRRKPTVEPLETRRLLAQLPTTADVDLSGDVTALDALIVINRVRRGETELANPADRFDPADVNRDLRVSAVDALMVINRIRWADDSQFTWYWSIDPDAEIAGVSPQELRWAILAAGEFFESQLSIDVRLAAPGPGVMNIATERTNIDGVDVRGLWKGGATIYLHNGDGFAPGAVFRYPEHITPIVAHEAGHAGLFGGEHSDDPTCLMHTNAPLNFCGREYGVLSQRYGVR